MMELTVTQVPGTPPVTVLHVDGRLDGSSYDAFVVKAQELYTAGARNLVLDLGKMTFLSSAGIVGLHRVALLFAGKKIAGLEEGWAAFRSLDKDRDSGVQEHVRLLNPAPEVKNTLEMVGYARYFQMFTDEKAAIASFK